MNISWFLFSPSLSCLFPFFYFAEIKITPGSVSTDDDHLNFIGGEWWQLVMRGWWVVYVRVGCSRSNRIIIQQELNYWPILMNFATILLLWHQIAKKNYFCQSNFQESLKDRKLSNKVVWCNLFEICLKNSTHCRNSVLSNLFLFSELGLSSNLE